jgi:putative CocE/NonD family hydrolase
VEHPNYDEFWQSRNLLPHLKKVPPAVMTVGGWFDAEDLYGALKIYKAVEKQDPDIFNVLVMGPWSHGAWSRPGSQGLGDINFGTNSSAFYQREIELPFFEHYLKGKGQPRLPEAYVFETGVNRWRTFDHWPPSTVQKKSLYFRDDGKLVYSEPSSESDVHDEYVSDPKRPVPFTDEIAIGMTTQYMTDDQRFAARRPDVLVYETEPLTESTTLAGPLLADLWVSTSGTDSDWIVKLIDVFPPDAKDTPGMKRGEHLGGYQMMVRSEVLRGRFRNSGEHPEPFVSNQPTRIKLELLDVMHTFQPGHRIMFQVQSTWFPLVDRNPQKFVENIYLADDKDFTKATQRVYRSKQHPSCVHIEVLPRE